MFPCQDSLNNTTEVEESSDQQLPVVSEIEEQLHCLQQGEMLDVEVIPEDYINADERLETTGELTNEEIVAQVQSNSKEAAEISDDEDEDDESPSPGSQVTLSEAQTCILKLRLFLQNQEDTSSYLASIDIIERYIEQQRVHCKQSKLTDFFSA